MNSKAQNIAFARAQKLRQMGIRSNGSKVREIFHFETLIPQLGCPTPFARQQSCKTGVPGRYDFSTKGGLDHEISLPLPFHSHIRCR